MEHFSQHLIWRRKARGWAGQFPAPRPPWSWGTCLVRRTKDLTSHAMKVTGLSWSAKAEMPREQRRLLGRHCLSYQGHRLGVLEGPGIRPGPGFPEGPHHDTGRNFPPRWAEVPVLYWSKFDGAGDSYAYLPAGHACLFVRAAPQTPPPHWPETAPAPKAVSRKKKLCQRHLAAMTLVWQWWTSSQSQSLKHRPQDVKTHPLMMRGKARWATEM